MADIMTKDERSIRMSRIRSASTKPEMKLRHALWHLGFRYRTNDKKLPGKPDIMLPKYRSVVFVHGCFWHRHLCCKDATTPKTRTEFWTSKFSSNVHNDRKNIEKLEEMGYQVIIIWECEIKKRFQETMDNVVTVLGSPHRGSR